MRRDAEFDLDERLQPAGSVLGADPVDDVRELRATDEQLEWPLRRGLCRENSQSQSVMGVV